MSVTGWFRRGPRRADLSAEMAAHLEEKIEALTTTGMSRAEAEGAARRAFGNALRMQERAHEVWEWPALESVAADLRFALRMLRRSPALTAVALLTLALAIGANTAMFSVVNGVLLNPLPFSQPDRLVSVDASKPNFPRGSISYPNFLDWYRLNDCFSAFAVARPTGYLLTGAGEPAEIDAAAISSDFFRVLGVQPVLGRAFTDADDRIGPTHAAIISTDLWRRKFAASPEVVGSSITLDGEGYIVAGVFPGHLDLPMAYLQQVDVYTPLGGFRNPSISQRGAGLGIHGLARLKPGLTLGEARAEMRRVTAAMARSYPAEDTGTDATLTPLKESLVGRARGFLLLLLGAVGFVLLIACVNLANLLLARGAARSREFALRAALGAGTGRLMRQMVTESLLLALLGGALGVGLAAAGTRAALAALPATLPRAAEVGMDGRVLAFAAAVTLLAGLLFGLIPALRASRRGTQDVLQDGTRGSAGASPRMQRPLVIAQVALALVLLAGAGLLSRSLAKLWSVNPGFDADGVLTFNLALPPAMNQAPAPTIRAALRKFDDSMARVPGVRAEALSWGAFPMYGEDDSGFWIEGEPRPSSESQMHGMLDYIVGPGYLQAMRTPLLAGRFFSAADNEHSRPVAVVDEVLARNYFPHGAVGHAIYSNDVAYEIVGVVGHVSQWGLDTDVRNSVRAQVYFPFQQMSDAAMRLVPSNTAVVVRGDGDPAALIASIRDASRRLNSDEAVTGFTTMRQIIGDSLAPRRFAVMLLGAFAALALLLAGIGLFGVIAYAVSQRTQEIGIRMALGAAPAEIFRLVVGQGLRLAAVGAALGLAAAIILVRLLSSFSQLLYGVSGSDPITLASVAALLLAIALAACYFPARRAMRVEPVQALRRE